MALLSTAERARQAARGGNEVNHTWKRYLTIGVLGVGLLLSLVVGVVAGQGGNPAAVPEAPGSGGQYGLSPPNERDADGGAAGIPGSGGAAYRMSGPNEQDPDGASSGDAASAPAPAVVAPVPNSASDLGTEFDPFVIGNSRPRYAGSGPGATDDGGPCREPGRSCNR